jgi:glycosyltransferase involved in cell wall biosynthesis
MGSAQCRTVLAAIERLPMADRRKVRVLLLTHELSLTGAPHLALRIFAELGSQVDLRIVAREDGPLRSKFAELGRTSILSPPAPTRLRDPWGWLQALIERAQARMWRPDLIYASSVLALPLARTLGNRGLPVLLHVHESTVSLAVFEIAHPGLVASIPDSYIAVSQVVADSLRMAYRIPLERIKVVPPFVTMSKAAVGNRMRQAGQPFIVGGMGNPSWTKGLALWLLAARAVADRRPTLPVRFRWVGLRNNMEGQQVRAMSRKLDLDDLVEFIPETPDAMHEMRQFDVLTVPSWEEAAPMVALEAMALEVPVIYFEGSGGVAEEVGLAGIAISTFSPSALADAIIEVIEHPERLEGLAAAASARVSTRYSIGGTVAPIAAEIARLSALGWQADWRGREAHH